jgi:SOS-response transcriptional repressor LexA
LLDDEATLKHVYRPNGRVVLRGANPAFLDIVIRDGGLPSVCILGKYVGLIRDLGSPR